MRVDQGLQVGEDILSKRDKVCFGLLLSHSVHNCHVAFNEGFSKLNKIV
jgi:hypothetical protein